MGLLDFLSTKPAPTQSAARPNALVVKPGSPQSGVLPTPAPTSNYKEVQYPIPSNTDQLGATVPPEPTGLVAKTQSIEGTNHVETTLDNGVKQVNHQNDAPEVKTVEVTQVAPVPPLPELNTSNAQYTYTDVPVSAQALANAAAESEPLPALLPQPDVTADIGNPIPPVVETNVEVPTDMPNPVLAPVVTAVPEIPANPSLAALPEISIPTPVVQDTPVEEVKNESPVNDIIEIGTPSPTEETPAEVPTESVVETPVVPTPEVLPEAAPVASEVAPEPVAEVNPIEEIKLETAPEPTLEKVQEGMTVLKKIAFVSLNSQGVNSSVSKNVKTIAESLKTMQVEVLIDSNKGYGMDVISGLSGTNNKVTAVYLKPYKSKYSDEATINVPLTNLTSIHFSTVLSRIRFLHRNSSVFIVPETSGLTNLSQLTFLLSTQAMYPGMAKPVILLGTAWKNRITALKENFALSQQEVDSMYYAANAQEALALLKKLDSEFSTKAIVSGGTVDLRSEGAEIDGLIVQ